MDLKLLEEFTELAQSRSFRQAAQNLGISPALLSSHIQSLENKIGVRLLERDAHRLVLTEHGKHLLTEAREITAEYQQLLSGLGTMSASSYRSIRIAMTGFIIPAKLGPYLDTVNLQYPQIHLEIFDDSRYSIASSLADNSVDVYFSYCSDELSFPGLEKEFVYSTRVQVLVPHGHHLAGKSAVSIRELDGERFVLYPETAEPAMRQCELSLLERSGISYSVYGGSVSPTAYYIMVPVGKGLVLCPWVLRHMIPPNATALSVLESDFTFSMYMFYRADSPNPYLPEFLDGFRNYSNRRPGL